MGTRFLCLLFKFLVLLYFDTVVDVFPASVSQNDSSVIGLACFRGIELLHIHFAGFKERGGNLRGKSGLAFLEKAVILPHDKGTFFVAAIIVFLPLMDGGTATGAFADRGLFLPDQIMEEMPILMMMKPGQVVPKVIFLIKILFMIMSLD